MRVVPSTCFVQFIHPGREHEPDSPQGRAWNRGPHRRQFLRTWGRTIGARRRTRLVLWGEWEPPADLVETIERPVRDGPRSVFEPRWHVPRSYHDLQNTDPCIFGGFFYSICKQNRASGPTQLQRLERGSVILFGSHLRRNFVLDTVFVVDRHIDHTSRDFARVLRGTVPPPYPEVALAPYYRGRGNARCGGRSKLRLYVGASVDAPVDGTYSFFPCARYGPGTAGFARPRIRLPGVVNPSLKQGLQLNRSLDPACYRALWKRVRAQVERQGCGIGVEAEFPRRQAQPRS